MKDTFFSFTSAINFRLSYVELLILSLSCYYAYSVLTIGFAFPMHKS